MARVILKRAEAEAGRLPPPDDEEPGLRFDTPRSLAGWKTRSSRASWMSASFS